MRMPSLSRELVTGPLRLPGESPRRPTGQRPRIVAPTTRVDLNLNGRVACSLACNRLFWDVRHSCLQIQRACAVRRSRGMSWQPASSGNRPLGGHLMRRCLPCNQHRNAPCRPVGCQAFTDNLQALQARRCPRCAPQGAQGMTRRGLLDKNSPSDRVGYAVGVQCIYCPPSSFLRQGGRDAIGSPITRRLAHRPSSRRGQYQRSPQVATRAHPHGRGRLLPHTR
jgi:hypothetical protein